MTALTITALDGNAVLPLLPVLANMRITLFREDPYRYDGNMEYEQAYLSRYAESGILVTACTEEGSIAGMGTIMPLAKEMEAIRAPFTAAGMDIQNIVYFGELLLLPPFRHQGHGLRLMRAMETEARTRFPAAALFTFCTVIREGQPPHHASLWRKAAYAPRPDLVAHLSWQEVGQQGETEHGLMFWVKDV